MSAGRNWWTKWCTRSAGATRAVLALGLLVMAGCDGTAAGTHTNGGRGPIPSAGRVLLDKSHRGLVSYTVAGTHFGTVTLRWSYHCPPGESLILIYLDQYDSRGLLYGAIKGELIANVLSMHPKGSGVANRRVRDTARFLNISVDVQGNIRGRGVECPWRIRVVSRPSRRSS